jgi:hypothetical protein
MAVGWTTLLGGAVVARSLRSLRRAWWFHAHRAMQLLLGLACVLAGFILIFG